MAASYERELELEFEGELEGLGEFEQHEGEHHELAHEFESDELAHEFEHHESAHEFEGEEFFGRAFRGIGRFIRRAAPILRSVARIAAPIVGTAIGGPFGAVLGRVASQALGEQEMEQHEWEHHEHSHEFEMEGANEFEHHETAHEFEFEGNHEFEHHEAAHEYEHHEASHEVAHEIAHHETMHHEALAEIMAEAAAHEQHEAQAEAMMGAAIMTVIPPRDRRALQQVLPHLVRGAAILTRILRRRRMTRPAVRAVPTIMRRTVTTLKRQAAAGRPITRRAAGRAAAIEVRRVLGSPTACAAAIRQNVRISRGMRGRNTCPTCG
jgi:hypothetical protein